MLKKLIFMSLKRIKMLTIWRCVVVAWWRTWWRHEPAPAAFVVVVAVVVVTQADSKVNQYTQLKLAVVSHSQL